MLRLLDIFFLIFHTILIFFNLFAWIFKQTRKLNLIILFLTGASWFVLGIFYGFGYCPFTDWHFNILSKLGYTSLPNSYVKYLADRITGLDFKPALVDNITLVSFFIALTISTYLNIRDFRKKRK